MPLFEKIKIKFQDSRDFVQKNQHFLPVISFFAGFTWDSLTISRIDNISDNMVIALYLCLLGILIILMQRHEQGRLEKPLLVKYSAWYPSGIQFFLGGLFSAYVVFYFKSASFTKSAIFLALLVILLVANEFLKHKLSNTYLLLSLYFLASFSFFIFFIPVITGFMNTFTFIAGSLAGLALPFSLMHYMYRKKLFSATAAYRRHLGLVGSLFFLMLVFYVFNLIPPVPLAIKYAGIFHHVSKNSSDNVYLLGYEKPAWYQFFKDDDSDFHYLEGDTVFCFTSVFAPTRLTKKIAHEWQYYSKKTGEWIVTDRTVYRLTGGRDGGYRGYTFKKNVETGKWRIDIITDDDKIIGRIKFEIMPAKEAGREFTTGKE